MNDQENYSNGYNYNTGSIDNANLVDDTVPDLSTVDVIQDIHQTVDTVPENVAGGKFDPFTPIEKNPLQNPDGFLSNSFNIRVKESNSDNKYLEAGTVSENYLLIENKRVHDICSEIMDTSQLSWSPVKTYFDGKKYRNVWNTTEAGADLVVGDTVNLMLTELNSYDGSMKAGFRIDFMVLSCLNGMISNKFGWGYSFRHNMQNVNWDQEIRQGALQIAGNMQQDRIDQFARACNQLQRPLDLDKLGELRNGNINKLPALRFGQVVDRYFKEHEEHRNDGTLWDLMQAGTYSLWHRDKMTNADFVNNSHFVDGVLGFASKIAVQA